MNFGTSVIYILLRYLSFSDFFLIKNEWRVLNNLKTFYNVHKSLLNFLPFVLILIFFNFFANFIMLSCFAVFLGL